MVVEGITTVGWLSAPGFSHSVEQPCSHCSLTLHAGHICPQSPSLLCFPFSVNSSPCSLSMYVLIHWCRDNVCLYSQFFLCPTFSCLSSAFSPGDALSCFVFFSQARIYLFMTPPHPPFLSMHVHLSFKPLLKAPLISFVLSWCHTQLLSLWELFSIRPLSLSCKIQRKKASFHTWWSLT